MQSSEFPFLSDWVVISLRWVSILAFSVSLTFTDEWVLSKTAAILFLSLWNILMTVYAMLNRRMAYHRSVNVAIDFLASTALIYLTGGIHSSVSWAGVISIFSAAIYYEWIGIALIIVILILSIVIMTLITNRQVGTYLSSIQVPLLVNIVTGIILGIFSHSLMKATRRIYVQKLSLRKNLVNRAKTSERSRMRTLYDLIETLSATLNFHTVLDTAVDLSYSALEALRPKPRVNDLVCTFLLNDENSMTFSSSRGFPQRDKQIHPKGDEGLLASVTRDAELKLVNDISQDPELSNYAALIDCKSILCLPLIRGMNVYGVVVYGHKRRDYFDEEVIDVLEMISHQSVVAIQNARLFQDLEIKKQRIIESQEEARKQLARDLHDGPTQTVSSIAMRLNVTRFLLDKDIEEARKEIETAEGLARQTTKEIRHMLFTLRPLILESEGLIPALESTAEKMHDTYNQNVDIDIDPDVVERLETQKQSTIFYIIEESLSNARKHANADKILVKLSYLPNNYDIARLAIVDNGDGFEVSEVMGSYERRGSLGMINLQERSELINSLLKVDSEPGKGTRIQVFIPLSDSAADLLDQNRKPEE